jgi:DNA (cytosine-5)-methyltransferase 1
MGEVLGNLAACGYDAEWQSLPAAAFGAPHIRERVFILCYANGDTESTVPVDDEAPWMPPILPHASRIRLERRIHAENGGEAAVDVQARGEIAGRDGQTGRNHWKTEPGILRIPHGIPDWMDRIECLGNAVVPQIAEFIGKRLMETMK